MWNVRNCCVIDARTWIVDTINAPIWILGLASNKVIN